MKYATAENGRRRKSALWLCCVSLALAAGTMAQGGGVGGVAARGRLLAPVYLNTQGPFSFLVDTCLARPVVTPAVAAYLGLPSEPGDLSRIELLECGTPPPHAEEVLVQDLSPLSERLGTELAGILPARQAGFEVRMDFGLAELAWAPLEAEDGVVGNEPASLPLRVTAEGAPLVHALVNGTHLPELLLDSVLPESVALPADLVQSMGSGKAGTRALTAKGSPAVLDAGGLKPGMRVRLDSLKVGEMTVERPICLILKAGAEGRIGLGLLRHTRLTVAYETGLAKIEALGAQTVTEPALGGCGVGLGPFRDGRWELQVEAGSAAHGAGLRTGDTLLRVNDLELDAPGGMPGLLASEIEKRLFPAPGTAIEIRARGREDRTVALVAEELL